MAKPNEKAQGSKKTEKKAFTKMDIIMPVLASFAFSFSFFIVNPLSFYFSKSNRGIFETNNLFAGNVVPALIIAALILFVLLAGVLIVLPRKVRSIAESVIAWLLVGGYVQALFFNGWTSGLMGDGNEIGEMPGAGVPNLLVWILLGVVIIGAPFLFAFLKKKNIKVPELVNMIFTKFFVPYLLILVLFMQGAGLAEAVLNAPEETVTKAFLTYDGMFEVSKNNNTIVFLVDRFDSSYYEELKEYDPDFFKDFDGFTSYVDNISLYGRTYPAVTSILTGVENDFSASREKYFEKAYGQARFLRDMKSNGYDVNVYTTDFYVYSDASQMQDYVDNTEKASESINFVNPVGFVGAMASYTFFNTAPDLFKSMVSVSTNSFADFAVQESDSTKYIHDDSAVYDLWQQSGGLTVKDEDNFTFLHLRGCHSPFNVDENLNNVGDGNSTSLEQTRGVFKLIKEYIADLKAKGLYENATIVITGDHASAISDTKDVPSPRITTLLVKEKGKSGTPMVESDAPVCQENLIPTLVKSSGIVPSVPYGKAYSEIGEDEVLTRKYLFQTYDANSETDDMEIEYSITGSARDFDNWVIKERRSIGNTYK